jgi:hypothetical protein
MPDGDDWAAPTPGKQLVCAQHQDTDNHQDQQDGEQPADLRHRPAKGRVDEAQGRKQPNTLGDGPYPVIISSASSHRQWFQGMARPERQAAAVLEQHQMSLIYAIPLAARRPAAEARSATRPRGNLGHT